MTYNEQPEMQEWIDQGRTKEQIFGAQNFLTGAGGRMIERLKQEAHKAGVKFVMEHKEDLKVVAAARLALIEELKSEVKEIIEHERGYTSYLEGSPERFAYENGTKTACRYIEQKLLSLLTSKVKEQEKK